MRTTTVKLGGKEYEVQRLPAMRAIAWRKQASALLDRFPSLIKVYDGETINTVQASADLFRTASGVVEELIECVLASDSALEADRVLLLEAAYEDEFLEAFQRVMLLNAPLSGMAVQATSTLNGASIPTISPS